MSEGEPAPAGGEPRPYRPVTTWFFLILVAVTGLVILANVLRDRYG